MPVIPVNKVVDPKRIIVKKWRRRRGTRGCWPPKKLHRYFSWFSNRSNPNDSQFLPTFWRPKQNRLWKAFTWSWSTGLRTDAIEPPSTTRPDKNESKELYRPL
jgi:hypothetical protein